MLTFSPERMIALRELDRPHSVLVRAGISPATATKLLNYHTLRITLAHVEKLCVLLHCTPNDLLNWRPDEKSALPETHPLHALRRTQKISNIREMIQDLPVEKLSELENVIADFKNRLD